jgi:hypothetical protein
MPVMAREIRRVRISMQVLAISAITSLPITLTSPWLSDCIGLTAPDDQHPGRRCFVLNDVLIGVIAFRAFECAQIVTRLVWLDASKHHFRAALRAWCLHQAITE